jgi:hypothetical protein
MEYVCTSKASKLSTCCLWWKGRPVTAAQAELRELMRAELRELMRAEMRELMR